MVLITDAMVCAPDRVDGEFPIVGRNRNQFASSKFFRGTTFVGVDMSRLGADHGMIRIRQRFETEAIGCGAIEYDEDVNVGAKMLLKFAYRGLRITVISISNRMTLVGRDDGLYDFRMDAGIVVAGKAAPRFHSGNNVAEGISVRGPNCPA